MLLHRLLTAAVLIPIVVAGVLLAPSQALAIAIGLIVLIGAREMAVLCGLKTTASITLYIALVAALMLLGYQWRGGEAVVLIQGIAAVGWIVMTALLVMRRRPVEKLAMASPRYGILLLGALVLTLAWLSVLGIHELPEVGPALLLFTLVLIWTADSGAYFAGRAWGKTKLSPEVSPGKTWAGVAGAMLGAVLIAVVPWYMGLTDGISLWALIALCLVVTAVSIGGDLWESLLKRQAGMKDSGTLLPGHGGALDRLDSVLAAAPVFAIGLYALERLA